MLSGAYGWVPRVAQLLLMSAGTKTESCVVIDRGKWVECDVNLWRERCYELEKYSRKYIALKYPNVRCE